MQAIILVGGLGTRLQSVITNLPKPMAPINNKPFLAYLIAYLKTQGITKIYLPVFHLREAIQAYFKNEYLNIPIEYIVEDEPLGTGGAILNTIKQCELTAPLFVLNGDTFIQMDYSSMVQQKASLTIALRSVSDCARYGKVIVDNEQRILDFKEKGEVGAGLINAGVYLLQPNIFKQFVLPQKFSFETDFLVPYVKQLQPQAFFANEYFIDIGVPEDYAKAANDLPLLLS